MSETLTWEELLALPAGEVVELVEDIRNPDVDRRYRHEWRREPLLRAGTRFRTYPFTPDWGERKGQVLGVELSLASGRGYDVLLGPGNPERAFARLAEMLKTRLRHVPTPALGEMLGVSTYGRYPADVVLAWLIERKRVKPEAVLEANAALGEMTEEAYDALCEKHRI